MTINMWSFSGLLSFPCSVNLQVPWFHHWLLWPPVGVLVARGCLGLRGPLCFHSTVSISLWVYTLTASWGCIWESLKSVDQFRERGNFSDIESFKPRMPSVSPFRSLLFFLSSVLCFQCVNPTCLVLHIFLNIGGFWWFHIGVFYFNF